MDETGRHEVELLTLRERQVVELILKEDHKIVGDFQEE